MIRFDKIKFLVPATAVDGYLNNPSVEATTKDGEAIRYKFCSSNPLLYVIVTPKEYKASIEFSGKILGERYPELINRNTFRECIDRINRYGVLHLDPDPIIEGGEVIQCDVTADIELPDYSNLKTFILQYLNSPKWAVRQYSGGVGIEKNVKTSKYRRRLTIYDKGAEMKLKNNADFVAMLENRDEVETYFQNKTRLELNLTSKRAIRDSLNISSTSIKKVLEATSNPIRDIFLEAVRLPSDEKQVTNMRDFERLIVLQHFNYEIPKIKDSIRRFYKDGNGLNKVIKVYRELAQALRPADFGWLDALLDQVA